MYFTTRRLHLLPEISIHRIRGVHLVRSRKIAILANWKVDFFGVVARREVCQIQQNASAKLSQGQADDLWRQGKTRTRAIQ